MKNIVAKLKLSKIINTGIIFFLVEDEAGKELFRIEFPKSKYSELILDSDGILVDLFYKKAFLK